MNFLIPFFRATKGRRNSQNYDLESLYRMEKLLWLEKPCFVFCVGPFRLLSFLSSNAVERL